MPILEVEIVGRDEGVTRPGFTQDLADAAAKVLITKPGSTWVKVRFIERELYAENGGTPEDIKPVFVSVLLGRCQEQKEQARLAKDLATTISKVTDRPAENIHILFEPEGVGRIAFGGNLRAE